MMQCQVYDLVSVLITACCNMNKFFSLVLLFFVCLISSVRCEDLGDDKMYCGEVLMHLFCRIGNNHLNVFLLKLFFFQLKKISICHYFESDP